MENSTGFCICVELGFVHRERRKTTQKVRRFGSTSSRSMDIVGKKSKEEDTITNSEYLLLILMTDEGGNHMEIYPFFIRFGNWEKEFYCFTI